VRDGPALLAGLVACGRCGSKMTVRYQRGRGGKMHPVYVCSRDKADYVGSQCQQLAGSCVDAHVTGLLLAAVAPAALEVSLAAAGQVQAQREQVDRIWRQRLERAGFAAGRARRQYQLAEPENRLVVRQLEKDWEAALVRPRRQGGHTPAHHRRRRPGPARCARYAPGFPLDRAAALVGRMVQSAPATAAASPDQLGRGRLRPAPLYPELTNYR
jgi:hypothetical protein